MTSNRRYTAEMQWEGRQSTETAALDLVGNPSGVSNADVLQAVESLRRDVLAQLSGDTVAAPAQTGVAPEHDTRVEIARMASSIGRAKIEIAAIKHPEAEGDDRLGAASNELKTIVRATENATSNILEASEHVNGHLESLRLLVGDDGDLAPLADQISNHVLVIMESCNFQDLTGQRITKVVQTLEFIEQRVRAIIEAWGVEEFKGIPLPEKTQVHSSDTLVSGPQEEGDGISQEEIDALFD